MFPLSTPHFPCIGKAFEANLELLSEDTDEEQNWHCLIWSQKLYFVLHIFLLLLKIKNNSQNTTISKQNSSIATVVADSSRHRSLGSIIGTVIIPTAFFSTRGSFHSFILQWIFLFQRCNNKGKVQSMVSMNFTGRYPWYGCLFQTSSILPN